MPSRRNVRACSQARCWNGISIICDLAAHDCLSEVALPLERGISKSAILRSKRGCLSAPSRCSAERLSRIVLHLCLAAVSSNALL